MRKESTGEDTNKSRMLNIAIGILLLVYGVVLFLPDTSITGSAVSDEAGKDVVVIFTKQAIPLGSYVEVILNDSLAYQKNSVSFMPENPTTVVYNGIGIYGWETSMVVNLSMFGMTTEPGAYQARVRIVYDGMMIEEKETTIIIQQAALAEPAKETAEQWNRTTEQQTQPIEPIWPIEQAPTPEPPAETGAQEETPGNASDAVLRDEIGSEMIGEKIPIQPEPTLQEKIIFPELGTGIPLASDSFEEMRPNNPQAPKNWFIQASGTIEDDDGCLNESSWVLVDGKNGTGMQYIRERDTISCGIKLPPIQVGTLETRTISFSFKENFTNPDMRMLVVNGGENSCEVRFNNGEAEATECSARIIPGEWNTLQIVIPLKLVEPINVYLSPDRMIKDNGTFMIDEVVIT